MEQFQERLSRLAELSVEELEALEAEVTEAFDAADAEANLEDMQALADALDQIREAKIEKDAGAEPEAVPAVPAAADPLAASAEGDGSDGTEPSEEVQSDEAAAEAAVSSEEATEEAPEPAPAVEDAADEATSEETPTNNSADEPAGDGAPDNQEDEVAAEVTASDVPEDAQPVQASASAMTIRAGGDIPGLTSGTVLNGMDDVVDALTRKINSMRGVTGDGEHIIVASARTEVEPDEDRILKAGDANGNARKIRQLLNDKEQLTPSGLTAAGWCAPRTPIYDVPTMGVNDRPIRSGLPSFNAERGGITWAQPPTLPTADFGVGIWRYEDGEWGSYDNPEGSGTPGAVKPRYTIECGTEASIDVDALTLTLCFNNMMVRAFPEWVRANTDLVMVAQARFAEQVALSQMFSVATTGTCGTPATSVGVARDFLYTAATAAAEKRWELRLAKDAPLQLLAPSWAATAIAIDLGLQAPGDGTYAIGEGGINGYFGEFNIDPIWYMDDAPGTAAFGGAGCSFPVNAHWLMFPTGTFLRLDTGELNLGVVRTKEDLEKNSYCEFSETFETVAYMGPADKSWVTRGLTAVNLFGATGAPVDLTV